MDWDVFLSIERKYGLTEANIEGYYFWNFARFKIGWQCEKEINSLQEGHSIAKERYKDKILIWVNKVKNFPRYFIGTSEQNDILIICHPRRVLIDGYYECIYTEQVSREFSNITVIEGDYQGKHYKPIQTKHIIYTDPVDALSFLKCVYVTKILPKRFQMIKNKIMQYIEMPVKELNDFFSIHLKIDQWAMEMTYGFFSYEVERWYYKRILDQKKPKIVVEVVSYSRGCMIVNELAKERGIVTVEMQHGTIGKQHGAYNYPAGSKIRQFPDYVFVFSDYWKNKARFPISSDKIVATGYPFLERMNEKYASIREKERSAKNILFLSSGPIGDRLGKIAYELSKKLSTSEYHIIYKLHPGEYAVWREKYTYFIGCNIEVIDSNRHNLYELFAKSDIQISGYNTTAIFEGLFYNLPTYVLNYDLSDELQELCDAGYISRFSGTQDLLELIQNSKKENIEIRNKLWSMDSDRKVREKLLELIKNEKGSEKG